MGDEDYGIVCAVFVATATIIAGSAIAVAYYCFSENIKEPSIKEIVMKRMTTLAWCLYGVVSFGSFVQDNGAPVGFIDYLCDKNELFGLVDWRKKTTPREDEASILKATPDPASSFIWGSLRCPSALLLWASSISLATAMFWGTCYSTYDFFATACDEVNAACTSANCISDNGAVTFECSSPYWCSGLYKPFTVVQSPENLEACNAMSVSSCSDAEDKFINVGCSCFTCTETNGKIDEVSCTIPFTCPPHIVNPKDTARGPEMSSEDYVILCAVYLGSAFALASVVTLIASCRNSRASSAKESVKQKMSPVTKCLYMALFASFVKEDGSPMGFIDYLCKMRDLMGFLDGRTGRTISRARWMRFIGVLSALMVTTSLGFVFGTIMHNTYNCSSTMNYCGEPVCQTLCGAVNIGCDERQCKSSSLFLSSFPSRISTGI